VPQPLQQAALKGIDAQLASMEEKMMVGLGASGRKAFEGKPRLEELCELEQLMKFKAQVGCYRRACRGAEIPRPGQESNSKAVAAGAFA
jgi:hypothetical protein